MRGHGGVLALPGKGPLDYPVVRCYDSSAKRKVFPVLERVRQMAIERQTISLDRYASDAQQWSLHAFDIS